MKSVCMIAAFGLLWGIGEMPCFSFLLYMLLMGFIPKKWSDIYSPASQIYLKQQEADSLTVRFKLLSQRT